MAHDTITKSYVQYDIFIIIYEYNLVLVAFFSLRWNLFAIYYFYYISKGGGRYDLYHRIKYVLQCNI